MPYELNGIEYSTDEQGYLTDFSAWSKELALIIATSEEITMTDEHWQVIEFLRGYYNEFKIAPAVRVLVKAIKRAFGPEKGNSIYLYELFPLGPGKQACKIAGLPKPTGCI